MSPRTTATLVVGGIVLTAAGIALVVVGTSGAGSGTTLAGIALALAGLICLRIVYWSVRVRRMTELGESFHVPGPDDAGPPPSDDPSR